MFLTIREIPLLGERGRARAVEEWREAARLVWTRWEVFLDAEHESRGSAFASYVAALDAEQAAAVAITRLAVAAA